MAEILDTQLLYQPPVQELRFLPEGPYPCGEQKFSWVSIQHGPLETTGSLNIFDTHYGSNESIALPFRPGFAFACDREHHFLIGGEHSLVLYNTIDGSQQTIVDGIDAKVSGTIINDGVTWDGNLVFGCKDLKFQEAKAGLYFWRAKDRKLFQLRDDQTCSNGKAILAHTPQSATLLDIDTPTKCVMQYELNLTTGKLDAGRIALDLRAVAAFPDGMILTPDQQSVVIAFYNPEPAEWGETRQYRLSDGQLERVWRTMGSPQATCPQWILRKERVGLVITTAVENMPIERQSASPNAGAIFYADTDYTHPAESPLVPLEALR